MVECIGQKIAEWLKGKVPQLNDEKAHNWLHVSEREYILVAYIISFLPEKHGRREKMILSLWKPKMKDLGTPSWKCLRTSEKGHGKLLALDLIGAAKFAERVPAPMHFLCKIP